jgi:hypothetical protein
MFQVRENHIFVRYQDMVFYIVRKNGHLDKTKQKERTAKSAKLCIFMGKEKLLYYYCIFLTSGSFLEAGTF